MLSLLVLAGCASALFVPSQDDNMNGLYTLSPTPGGDGTFKKFPKQYKDYPRGAQYFDVYSPSIKSLYSQVFWTGLDPAPIPPKVVEQFAGGKAMTVIGFELDQVRKTPDGDVSVPINAAYNHHFESTMVGASSDLKKIVVTGPEDPQIDKYHLRHQGHCHTKSYHAGSEHWVVENLAPLSSLPTSQSFGAANGGEVRKTFHGFAPGYGKVIVSPEKVQITPMQIDTWNRDKMNLTGSKFVAGPLPRSSLAAADAEYSGLLECPLTTRIRKDIEGDYEVVGSSHCDTNILTAAECFVAASKQLKLQARGLQVNNVTMHDLGRPKGCTIQSEVKANKATVFFNTNAAATTTCGANETSRTGFTKSLVELTVALDLAQSEVEITMAGPADVWFGVGFNAQAMKDAPWAIIVDGHGQVSERKLEDQNPGKQLPPSVTVVSNNTVNGVRTVVLRRAMQGKTADYYSFQAGREVELPFINAVGNGPDLAYHKMKTGNSLALLPMSGPSTSGACVCATNPAPFGQAKGTLNYEPNVSQKGEMGKATTIGFGNKCAPQPRSDLLAQKNPTCDVRTYVGGQIACHHMFSLLDADQDIPWPDQPLEYHLKMRFWYQEYDSSYHTNALRTTWGIASPVEYDVPKCAEGVPGCDRGTDGRWIHTITGTFKGAGDLLVAHFHCHAPTCISMTMYRDWNGTHGNLLCEERTIFGGTGRIDQNRFDEPGFILQPPCVWGSSEFGLEAPPNVDGTTLHTIKKSYADSGHHGEMAWQQMLFSNSKSGDMFV